MTRATLYGLAAEFETDAKLMHAADGSFLADDTQLAPYEVGGGWMHLGRASVGERSFVGNSGIVSPGRAVPDHSLVVVDC